MSGGPITVLKAGGELLETADDLRLLCGHIAAAAAAGPVVVVHGGGGELSKTLARQGEAAQMVDGIRVTDGPALAAAVQVLGGTINTRLVAALVAAGVRAVGLTGADGAVLLARRSPPRRTRNGELVDLGHVGVPISSSDPSLLRTLCAEAWVPVLASLGVTAGGELLNVNADDAASHLAIALRASRLVVLGGTAGVLDHAGATVPVLTSAAAESLIDAGVAAAGMAAKLEACIRASSCGVDVWIASGRSQTVRAVIAGAGVPAAGDVTRLAPAGVARAS